MVRGRWKFVSSASTRRNANPGVMKRSERPSSGAPARQGLEHTGGRGPDREHALGGLDARPRGGLHPVALAVHLVLLDPLGCQRPESVQPDVERDALVVETGEQLGREVQSRRRRRRGACVPRVHGLVALGIVGLLVDVWRKGQLARRLADGANDPSTVAERLDEIHERAVGSVSGLQALARPQAARGPGERLPDPAAEWLDEQHLDLSPARPARTQPRRHDARVVHDREVTRQLVREVGERPVPHLPGRTVEHEQARGVAPCRRMLGDQVGREVVVELG